MKKATCGILLLLAAFLVFVSVPATRAEEPKALTRLADVHLCYGACEKVKSGGEIVQVIKLQYSMFHELPSHALLLRINGAEGEFIAYMGPDRYLRDMGYTFTPGDRIELDGVLAVVNGQKMLVADHYADHSGTYALRNGEGYYSLSER